MKLKDALEGRRSVRRFHHKKPDWRKILRALDAVRFISTARNHFVTKFILVSEERKLKELAAASQQKFVEGAKYIVVAVSDDSDMVKDFGEKGVRYTAQQAGAAIQNFLLALTEQKLVTTWVGHFYEEQVRRTLLIPEGLKIEAMFPIGTETKVKTIPKPKIKLEHVVYFEKWGNDIMIPYIYSSPSSL